jgi:putative endonuclease
MYSIYIIRCEDGSLYTGITTDVERRFAEHREGRGGRYTRAHGAVEVVYEERSRDRSSASKREAEIKRLTRAEKLDLIRQG